VNQREVHTDTTSFTTALRAALREDPDVVLIGEMRDLETVESALRIAETGHLTFGTLHTNSAAQTINRIIDVFPSHQQSQIRTQLSLVLEGIVCQALLPRANGHRAGRRARDPDSDAGDAELDPRRQGAPDLFRHADRPGKGRHADDEPVADLAVHEAADHARDRARRLVQRDELQEMINRGAGVVAGRGLGRPARSRQ
jgi:twitching motility protein PilT